MGELIFILALGVLTFAATNLDDLFLLVAWHAAGGRSARQILLGQYLGQAALVALGLQGYLVAPLVPALALRLLGVLPIAIGAGQLWRVWRPARSGAQGAARPAPAARWSRVAPGWGAAQVALVTIANGGDNLGVYFPLFSTQSAPHGALLIAVYAGMTWLWCRLAQWLVGHPRWGAPLRRWGGRLLPWVLIGLGVLILM